MPEALDNKLSQAQRDHIIKWLADRGVTNETKCPACGKPGWFLAEHLVQPVTIQGGGLSFGGIGYPQVMMISEVCGYTAYFNAVVIGAVPGEPREATNGKE